MFLVGKPEGHLLVELLADVELHGVDLDGVDEEAEVDLPLLGLVVVGDAQVGLRLLQSGLDRQREICARCHELENTLMCKKFIYEVA